MITRYPSNRDLVLSILFVDKYVAHQFFIELDFDENFKMMLDMHEVKKEVTIYAMTQNNARSLNEIQQWGQDEYVDEPQDDDDSENCPIEESYHSHLSTDNENELLTN
ncbi:hypothetical protein Tco_1560769 [Tanacetum coccineum]